MLRSNLVLLCFSALLSAQVRTLGAGFVRYDDGTVHAAQGIEASFVLGKPLAVSVDAASFSDYGGIISAKGTIRLLAEDGSEAAGFESGESHPVLHISGDFSTAAAWLPSRHSILYWDGAALAATSLTNRLPGQVSSIRLSGRKAELLVVNEKAVSAITISLETGDELSVKFLAGVTGRAIWFKNYLLYQDEGGLEAASEDGSSHTLLLSTPGTASELTVEPMSSDWLHIYSQKTNRHWAMHVTAAGLQLSELPGQPASSESRGGK